MSWLPDLIQAIIALALAITVREVAVGYAARAMGDSTGTLAGRITLNPIKHADPIGTVIFPGILMAGQLATLGRVDAVFGWPKRMPMDIRQFHRAPRGDLLAGLGMVSAAGPLANFFFAWLMALLVWPVGWGLGGMLSADSMQWVYGLLVMVIRTSILIGLFNLLPIPPLDGGYILAAVLPRELGVPLLHLEKWGGFIVLGLLIVLPRLGPGLDVIGDLLRPAAAGVLRAVLWAAGHG